MYQVYSSMVGSMATNCYTVINMDSKDAILIDASGHISKTAAVIRKIGANLKTVLLTHAHFDHIDAIPSLRSQLPDLEVCIGVNDAPLLNDPTMNLSQRFGRPIVITSDHVLRDGQTINLIGLTINCIEVSGHTIGGMCYYVPKLNCVFTGDTLVKKCIGRTDFPKGNKELLIKEIKDKLFTLPKETVVFPGHDDKTTIEQEIQFNSCLK